MTYTNAYGINVNPILAARFEAENIAMEKRSYSYNGYRPLPASTMILDSYVDRYFDKNVTEYLINEEKATFTIIDDELAVLAVGRQKINFWNDKKI